MTYNKRKEYKDDFLNLIDLVECGNLDGYYWKKYGNDWNFVLRFSTLWSYNINTIQDFCKNRFSFCVIAKRHNNLLYECVYIF